MNSCFQQADSFQDVVKKALEFEREKKYGDALEQLSKAINIDSTKSFVFVLRGKIKSLLQNDRFALIDFSKAITLNPNNTSAYFYRAISYSLLGSEDSAISNYSAAIQTKTTGSVYSEGMKRNSSNIEEQMDIEIKTVKFFRGKAYYNIKKDDKALEDFKFSLSSDYNVVESQFYIGVILISKHQNEGCSYLLKAKNGGSLDAQQYLEKYCK